MVSYTKKLKHVIIFYRALFEHSVKTRLAKGLDSSRALACYRLILEYIEQETADRSYTVIHAVDRLAPENRYFWVPDMLQVGNTLVSRMRHACDTTMRRTRGKVMLMGSDIPDIRHEDIEDAFAALEHSDLYILPSDDGGYGLIGMGRPCHNILADTSEESLSSLLQRADAAGYSVEVGRTVHDIDTVNDLYHFLDRTEKTKNQENLCLLLKQVIQ